LVSWGYLLASQRLSARPVFRGRVCPSAGSVFGANAAGTLKVGRAERTVVFVPCPDGTVALEVKKGRRASFARLWTAPPGGPNGRSIVAGGAVLAVSTGADGGGGAPDVLFGMEPATGRVLFEERLPPVERFVTPAAGAGEVFVWTSDGVVTYRPS
jgi:hypothetical protein